MTKELLEYLYHYTYRITNIEEKKYYYGVHSSNIEPKLDLGIKYFSSSLNKSFINDQKINTSKYKYKVIKFFNSKIEALQHEIYLHAKFNVKKHQSFYNDCNSTSTGFSAIGKKGRKHSQKTKDLIAKNGTKDRVCYNNGFFDIYLKENEEIPIGFFKGGISKPIISEKLSNKIFYSNLLTKESFRLDNNIVITDPNIIKGRLFFNNEHFDIINSGEYITSGYDLKNNCRLGIISKTLFDSTNYYIDCPINIEKRKLFIYKDILFTSVNDYTKYLRDNNLVIIYLDKLKKVIITEFKGRSIHNNKNCTNYIELSSNIGRNYSDFGYMYFTLNNFNNFSDKIQNTYIKKENYAKRTFRIFYRRIEKFFYRRIRKNG